MQNHSKFQDLAVVILKDQNSRIKAKTKKQQQKKTVLRTLILYNFSVKYELKYHSIAL